MAKLLQQEYVIYDHINTSDKGNSYKLYTISVGAKLLNVIFGGILKVENGKKIVGDDTMALRLYDLLRNDETVYMTKIAANNLSPIYYDKFKMSFGSIGDPTQDAWKDANRVTKILRKNSDKNYETIHTCEITTIFVSPVDEEHTQH